MDGAQLPSIKIAEHKASTAATFRRETKFFEKAINLKNLSYLLTLDGVIAPRGGIPLTKQGKIIDTIGCSGGMDSQDEVVCKAGAGAIKQWVCRILAGPYEVFADWQPHVVYVVVIYRSTSRYHKSTQMSSTLSEPA